MSITFTEDQVEETQEYVDDLVSYSDDDSSLNEAIKRIEQAKLYESLIKHDFFGPGSARPEIQDKVTSEIRTFILERLEELMGMKSPKHTIVATEYHVFDENQVAALREIANKLIQKTHQQPVVQTNPQVRQYADTQRDPTVTPARMSSPTVNQVPAQPQSAKQVKPQPKPQVKAPAPKPAEPLQTTSIYVKPAVSKTHPPKPMPTNMEMNMRNAAEVSRRQGAAGADPVSQILGLAKAHALSATRSEPEDLGPLK